jgi:hypothetical protein
MSVPDLWLEQLALGELTAPRTATLKAILGDQDLAAQLAGLEASSREILARYPSLLRAPRPAATRRPRAIVGWLAVGVAGAAAALTLVVSPPDPRTPSAPATAPEVLPKGDPIALRLYRKAAGGQELLRAGQSAAARDVVQVAYRVPGGLFGVIVSVDGRGVVTQHLPEEPGPAVPLQPDHEVPLPHAYELDDAPELERFYLVVSERPFDSSRIAVAAQAAQGRHAIVLDLEPELRQTSFELHKEPLP